MEEAGPDPAGSILIRAARIEEIPVLEHLIAASARSLSQGFYDDDEIEAAIAHVFGVDSDLVVDGTYLVVEEADRIVACGGWSRRRTMFGGDRFAQRDPSLLDPAVDAARIRAFFVAPDQARRGLATRLLTACEAAAAAQGFSRTALMATLPGVPFYARRGYRAEAPIQHPCGDLLVRFVPMRKELLQK